MIAPEVTVKRALEARMLQRRNFTGNERQALPIRFLINFNQFCPFYPWSHFVYNSNFHGNY